MPQLFQRYATPFITGFFLISLISGIALFFHFGPSGFRGMHEWLSMVLILPFVLHLWKNWKPMLGYFRRTPMLIALILSLGAASVFLYPTGEEGATGGPPQFQLANRMMSHSVAEVAPAIGSTPEAMGAALTAAGFTLADPAQSLTDIATSSGKTTMDLAAALLSDPAS